MIMHGTNMEHPFTGKSWRTKLLNIVYYMRKKIYLWGSFYSIFSFMCMFWFSRSLFVLLYFFLLIIVLSVLLRFTDSDYPFGIFKLLFCSTQGFFWHQISIHKFLRIWCFRTTKLIFIFANVVSQICRDTIGVSFLKLFNI
jgi:hypothetical protein